MTTATTPILMTVEQVAHLLAISPSTVRRAIAAGRLAVTRPADHCVRITQASIDTWISASTSTTTAE